MNPPDLPPAPDADDEPGALIGTLHATDRRLEEPPAGQADALPAHIALLDSRGVVMSVNEVRRRLGADHGPIGPPSAVGVNYLEICDAVRGDGAAEARQVAKGIRSVLGHALGEFSLEYACPTPTGQRWFLMTVSPLASDGPGGAIVLHLDLTQQKRDEETLQRFAAAMEAVPDAIYLVDRSSMSFIHVNAAACRMRRQTREALIALGPAQVLGTSRAELERTYDAVIASGQGADPLEMPRLRDDGSTVWVELRRHALRTRGRWMIVTLVRDITERKATERRVAYLNRVYAVLSGINTLIVRVRDRQELFRTACRIAVEKGGFRMSWIGIVEQGAMAIVELASTGVSQELANRIKKLLASDEGAPPGSTMASQAIGQKRAFVANDLQNRPRFGFGKNHAEAGIISIAVLPLIVAEQAVGVLALCAAEAEFFHAEELELLTELAGNIAFAIDHLDKQDRLHYLAYHDVLTGLANRTLFLDRTGQQLRSAAGAGQELALYLVDLERFNGINDSLGWPAGDLLLKQVAQWLTANSGDASLLARVGADKFAGLLPVVRQDGNLVHLLEATRRAFLAHPFNLNGTVLRVAARIGLARFPGDGADAETLLRHAEAALKQAKASGEPYLFYTRSMTEALAGRLNLENQLRHALERREFVLHYQPKVNLVSGAVSSVEALIRWNDPGTGLVPPGRFIPILEETGLIHEVGRWALQQAVADYLRWQAMGLVAVPIAVNVSAVQLRHRGFIADIAQVVGVDSKAAGGLELEITESLIMDDVLNSIASLQAIRAMGVSIAIDDFGTGFSSLSHLARLPVDRLKIDRSFVVDMTLSPEGLSLVSTIINLAHSLKLKVVAEGVETDEQARLLRLLNCDEMQGYLFSRPLPCAVLEARHLCGAPPHRPANAAGLPCADAA